MAQKYLPFEEAVERYNNGQQWYDTTREIPVSAPVKKKKKKDKFFDSGAFSDGYQFGDVTKAILGTGADVVTSAGKGVWDVGQGTAKLIVGGIAEAADLFGKDEYADKLRDRLAGKDEKVNKRLENIDVFGRANKVADKSSVLGEKTDRVFESVGQIGAYTVPVLGQASMFTSSAGSNLSEAYSKGATDAQAWTKALIGGGISVATEKLFGLFGESGLDTALANKISSKLTSGIAKTLARQGVQATAEGVEEVIEYAGDQLLDWAIDKVSNGKGAKLKEDWNWEEVGESFANAFISSTLVGAGQTALNIAGIKSNTDLNTKQAFNEYASQVDSANGMLTENEQKVLDNVIEQRIEEATQNQDLSKKEIKAIETQAKQDLQSGNISVETIENTLGLKNYINDVITDVESKMGRQITQQEANEISQLTRNRFLENLQNDRLLQNSYINEQNKANVSQNTENQVNVQPEQTAENKAENSQNENVTNAENIEQPVSNVEQESKPTIIENNELRDRAKQEIGTTTNLDEAGYLTNDGQYLDLSSYFMDHGEIANIYSDGKFDNVDGANAAIQDFVNRGNIKLDSTGVEIATVPTPLQYTELYEYLQKVQNENGDVFVDLDTETKNKENLVYNNKTSVGKMIEDIKEHYKKISQEATTDNNVDTQQVATKEEVEKQIKEKVPTTKETADKVEKKVTKQVNDAIAPLKDSIDEINKSIEKVMDNIAPMVEQANLTLEERIAKNKEIIDKIDYDKLYENMSAKDILEDGFNKFDALNNGTEYIPPQINIDEQGNKQVIPKEKSAFRQAKDTFKRLFTNSNVEIDNLAEESGNKNIKYAGDMLNSVMGEAQGDISVAQTNINGEAIGKSLNEIFSEANNSGLSEAFNDYLIQQSNIDRHEQGKGSIVPIADSELLVREYEKTYPQFKEWAKDVYQYGANTRANLVDAGIISQELSDKLANMYPHYVPFITDSKNINNIINDTGEIIPRNTIKRAKGGANIGQVLPVQEALERYTYSQKKAVRQNQLYQQLVATLSDGAIDIGADMREFDNNDFTSMSDSLYHDENGNYLTAYVDGERKSVRISEDLYNSLNNDLQNRVKDFENKFRFVTKPLQKISEVRRNLLTSWNPSFALTNPIKDIQDASLNSKYPTAMAKNVPRAVNELFRNNTDRVRQFRTLYGAVNAFGEFENNTLNQKAKNNKFVRNLINFNENMELAPRYAEFLASVENGASIQEAMYNAREVTTNFSRGGVIAKALNRNGFTFLNANIQGLSKFYRNIKGENGIRGTVGALTRAAVLGIAPAVFNEIAFGSGDDKDEEYEALPDYVKDNYYIIKTSDGNFIRIPKGRMLSIFGSAARRAIEAVEGEENAFEGYLKNAYDQVGVANPLNNNVFAPLIQAFGSENGTNWYGGDLVPTRLQDVPKGEQTDATIDAFSTWLGEKLNVSPYKINYVLDQYSGGIGDIFLPMMTQEATNDQSSLTGQLLAPIKDKFTVNATDDNKYVSDFYSKSEELQVKANSKNATDEDMLREKYMYSISKGMSELYKERREVQSDKSLTKEEKYAKSQAIKDEINRLAKEGLDNYKDVSASDNYATAGDLEYYKNAKGSWTTFKDEEADYLNSIGLTNQEKSNYIEAKNNIYDIKQGDYSKQDITNAIKDANMPDQAKMYLYDKYYGNTNELQAVIDSGINFDSYLDFAGQDFKADKTANGKTISGSKKQKVYNYINSMDNLNYGEKCILAKLEYKSDNRYNNQIIQYLNNSNLDYDTEASILKELGFKVSDDGRITW